MCKRDHSYCGISYVGHEKQILALLTILEEEHRHEVLATPSKRGTKGSRELKKLECSINFDARDDCSSHGKGKRVLLVFC